MLASWRLNGFVLILDWIREAHAIACEWRLLNNDSFNRIERVNWIDPVRHLSIEKITQNKNKKDMDIDTMESIEDILMKVYILFKCCCRRILPPSIYKKHDDDGRLSISVCPSVTGNPISEKIYKKLSTFPTSLCSALLIIPFKIISDWDCSNRESFYLAFLLQLFYPLHRFLFNLIIILTG